MKTMELPQTIQDYLQDLPNEALERVKNAKRWKTLIQTLDEHGSRCLVGHAGKFNRRVGEAFDCLFDQDNSVHTRPIDVSNTPEVAAIRRLAEDLLERRFYDSLDRKESF